MSKKITEETFNTLISEGGIIVLDFWAEWCAPCRTYGPIVDNFAEENTDIIVGKVNIDENRELGMRYGIRNIPTTVIIKDGVLITKLSGITPKTKLEELTNELK